MTGAATLADDLRWTTLQVLLIIIWFCQLAGSVQISVHHLSPSLISNKHSAQVRQDDRLGSWDMDDSSGSERRTKKEDLTPSTTTFTGNLTTFHLLPVEVVPFYI